MVAETLLQPAIVAAVVSAIVGPLIFFLLKRRDDRNRRNFEIRFAEFKRYLRALEKISSASHADFERFMAETYAGCLNEILATDGQSNEPLRRLNKEVNELTSTVRRSFTQATQELNGLRLVCSRRLLEMVNQFVDLQRSLTDESIAILGRVDQIDLQDPSSMISGRMKNDADRIQELFEKIVLQMRKELGVR